MRDEREYAWANQWETIANVHTWARQRELNIIMHGPANERWWTAGWVFLFNGCYAQSRGRWFLVVWLLHNMFRPWWETELYSESTNSWGKQCGMKLVSATQHRFEPKEDLSWVRKVGNSLIKLSCNSTHVDLGHRKTGSEAWFRAIFRLLLYLVDSSWMGRWREKK